MVKGKGRPRASAERKIKYLGHPFHHFLSLDNGGGPLRGRSGSLLCCHLLWTSSSNTSFTGPRKKMTNKDKDSTPAPPLAASPNEDLAEKQRAEEQGARESFQPPRRAETKGLFTAQ